MSDVPKRIQLSRKKGWRLPANAVNVARPTIFGNPFIHPDAAQAVEAYRLHCSKQGTKSFSLEPGGLQFAPRIHQHSTHWAWSEWLHEEGLDKIRGKDLACWCPLDAPCHADVLLELANGEDPA
jgi:hypothetical protein